MILVDTSVWVSHFRKTSSQLRSLLTEGKVLSHEFVMGELACGSFNNRREILALLKTLPKAVAAEHEEILQFIDNHKIMNLGIGLIDVHLLASSKLTKAPLWTLDKKLQKVAEKLHTAYH